MTDPADYLIEFTHEIKAHIPVPLPWWIYSLVFAFRRAGLEPYQAAHAIMDALLAVWPEAPDERT